MHGTHCYCVDSAWQVQPLFETPRRFWSVGVLDGMASARSRNTQPELTGDLNGRKLFSSSRANSLKGFEVLNGWKRIIKMMEQSFPLQVFGRLTKPNCVAFQRFPFHQEDVLVRILDASLKVVGNVPRHRSDDSLSVGEGFLEISTEPRADVQNSDFKNHLGPLGNA